MLSKKNKNDSCVFVEDAQTSGWAVALVHAAQSVQTCGIGRVIIKVHSKPDSSHPVLPAAQDGLGWHAKLLVWPQIINNYLCESGTIRKQIWLTFKYSLWKTTDYNNIYQQFNWLCISCFYGPVKMWILQDLAPLCRGFIAKPEINKTNWCQSSDCHLLTC